MLPANNTKKIKAKILLTDPKIPARCPKPKYAEITAKTKKASI
jgi:hypothetical protein